MNRHVRAIVSCSLAFAAACNRESDSGGSSGSPPPDPLPTVQSVFPGNLATGLAKTVTVSARFSEPMDAFYIAFTPSFTLESASGPVAGVITVSPDGRDMEFVPSSPLEYGTTYTATLESGTLSVSGQALAADHEWTFTIESPTDWEWSAPVVFTTAAPLNYRWPGIDIDDAGNGCAVWTQADGAGYRVYASRSAEGGPWETPVALQSDPIAYFSSAALVGMDESSQVLAVWSILGTIWFNWAGVSGSWGPAAQALGPLGVEAYLLKLFVDSDGNALLFYYTQPPGGSQNDFVFVVRYDVSLGWGTPLALGMRYATEPAYAGDRTGFAVVTWRTEGSPPGINARRYLPGSGWTAVETVDAPDANRPVERPSVTTDGAGNALAAWLKRLPGGSGQDHEIFISRCGTLTGWTQGEAGPAASNLNNNTARPQPALSPDGSALVAWMRDLDDRCWASYQSTLGDWTEPEPIDLNTQDHQGSIAFPHFTVDGRVVLFGSERIYNAAVEFVNIWVNEFDPATGWGSPTLLRTAENEFDWAVDRDSEGRAALLWLEAAGTMRWSRYR